MADTDDRMGGAGVPSKKRGRDSTDEPFETQETAQSSKGKGKEKAAADPSQNQGSSTGTSSSACHFISFVPGPTLFPEPGDSYLLEGSAPQPKKPQADFKAWSAKRKGESSKSGGGHSGGSGKGRNAGKKGGKGKKKKTKLQTSLHLHIRILWNMLGRSSVLKPVNGASIIEFDQKFADIPQPSLKEHVEGMLKASATSNAQVLTAVETVRREAFLDCGATTAQNASRLETSWLQRMFSSVAAVGLSKWEPDLLGHPDSVYNIVHEHVALSSYQALLGGLAYVQIAPGDLAWRLRLEMKEEGTNEKRDALVNTYKCRTWLRDNRVHQIKQDAYRPQVLQLALEAEAHSDDEIDPDSGSNNPEYLIRKKVGRSGLVTTFFRELDRKYHVSLDHQPGQRGDRIRKTQEDAQHQSLPCLPMDVPIDYFSPDYFNNFLSAKLHAHYAANGVALPLEQHCQVQGEVESWKNMKEEEFMEAYGNAVFVVKLLTTVYIPTTYNLSPYLDLSVDWDQTLPKLITVFLKATPL
ncbi:hypothetical protein GYMLUDRAFT_250257 [Collybiopsis luxurians FD-317 M1]|uniref:Uncharacterized protein n=1 Tax=Collybiopsis luxurians FD-317 M1 TaxID=944289 RepID=A0A0D0BVH2_9AGAR|nr:hypothetical protein GYMLUDRAFT_250257 [Collybiopsis luxurians FD-317 M1]